MVRSKRQQIILDIIDKHEVGTQGELVELLRKPGFDATQATVSRDIKELGLVKVSGSERKYKYVKADGGAHKISAKFGNIFKECVLSVRSAANIIVIKTVIGGANSACAFIDHLNLPQVIGTLAGDDTIFTVIADGEDVKETVKLLESYLV